MDSTGVAFFALLLFFLWNSFQRDRGQHRLIKLGHVCFLSFIMIVHCYAVRALGWSMFHPSRACEKLAAGSGVIPMSIFVPIWIVTMIAYCAAVFIAYAAAKRVPGSRRWLLSIIAVLWILDTIQFFRGDALTDTTTSLAAIMITWIIIMSIPYGLMFLFYSNKKVTRALFETPIVDVEERTPSEEPEVAGK